MDDRLLDRLRQHDIRQLLLDHRIGMAFLFGSRARGQETGESDLDLAVVMSDRLRPAARLDVAATLGSSLKRLLGLHVDVTVLNDASPLLRFEAVIRGVTVLGDDLDEVFGYEQRVRMQFEEFCHIQGVFVRELRHRLGLAS